MQDNTNKTTQELFDKLMLGFSKHFEKSSRRLDDDFEYEGEGGEEDDTHDFKRRVSVVMPQLWLYLFHSDTPMYCMD